MATYYVDSGTSGLWVASTAYVLGARVVCTTAAAVASRGYVKECTTAGTSAATEPVWTNVPGDTITDGTVVWTTREATDITNASAFLYYLHNHRIAAGDRIWLRTTHSETTPAAITFSAIGTAALPVEWLCAGTWVNNPTTLGTGAFVVNTLTNSITVTGFGYMVGLTIRVTTGSNNASLGIVGNNIPGHWVVQNCLLWLNTTSTIPRMVFGSGAGTSNDDQSVTLINTKVQFGNAAQGIFARSRVNWSDTPSALLGTIPTALFTALSSVPSDVELSGLDLSALTTALIDVSSATPARLSARNCSLGAGATLTTGTIPGQGGAIVTADNVSSSAINYSEYRQIYEGVLIQETTIVKTGGSSDGTTTLSCKMTSSAGTKFYAPLYSRWMPVWIDTVAVAKTITVDIAHDSLTALTDADVWVEVKYLSSATVPIESSVSDAAASLVATGVAQDASAATWTTTGLTNPNKQKLVSPSFTPQMKGFAMARVALAKPSYTAYVDGNPQVA